MSFEDMKIEIGRLEDEIARKETHFSISMQTSNKINSDLRRELETIKVELQYISEKS